jgi:hypothetical protein
MNILIFMSGAELSPQLLLGTGKVTKPSVIVTGQPVHDLSQEPSIYKETNHCTVKFGGSLNVRIRA